MKIFTMLVLFISSSLCFALEEGTITWTPESGEKAIPFEGGDVVITFEATTASEEVCDLPIEYEVKDHDGKVCSDKAKFTDDSNTFGKRTYTAKVTWWKDNTPNDPEKVSEATSTFTVYVFKVKLQEVSFSDNHTIKKDDSSSDYSAPHWTDNNLDGDADDSGEKKFPICYTRNTKAKVSAKIKLTPDLSSLSDVKIKVKAVGVQTFAEKSIATSTSITYPETSADSALDDKVDFLNPMTLNWKISIDDGTTWQSITSSANKAYISLEDPTASPLFETLVHIACEKASGKTDEATSFTAIWNYIKNIAVTTKAGSQLTYYGVSATGFKGYVHPNKLSLARKINGANFIVNRDGKCGNWQNFFINILKVHDTKNLSSTGINANATLIINKPIGALAPAFKLKDVKGQGPTVYPLEFIWPDHVYVKYNNKYYDPSYGVEYTNPINEIAQNIKSYGWIIIETDPNTPYGYEYKETETANSSQPKIK